MTTEVVLRTRPLSRALKNMGIEVDEEMTEGLAEMADVAHLDTFIEAGSDTPGLGYMTRYVVDRDSPVFGKTEYGVDQKDWETVEVLEGVIIDIKPYRNKRQNRGFVPGDDNPIECASPDMITGIGEPGGDCRGCWFAEWPTDEEKRGGIRSPWCGDRWRVFFKNEAELMPQYLDLPGGYKNSLDSYRRELKKRGAQTWQVITQMQVRQGDNKSFLECDIIGAINSEDEQVTAAISAMQTCISACIIQYSGWHLRYQATRKRDSDSEYPGPSGIPVEVEGTARDPQAQANTAPPRPAPQAPPAPRRERPVLETAVDPEGHEVWVNPATRQVFGDPRGDNLLYTYDDPDEEKVSITPDDVGHMEDVLPFESAPSEAATEAATNADRMREAQPPPARTGKLGALAAARERNQRA